VGKRCTPGQNQPRSQQRVIRPRWVDWPDALGWWYDAELDNWIKLKKRLTRNFFAPQPPRRWYGPWNQKRSQKAEVAQTLNAHPRL
jgi:hypothetical protein